MAPIPKKVDTFANITYLNIFPTKGHTVGKTVTKKKFWILDFTRFCCPSELSELEIII